MDFSSALTHVKNGKRLNRVIWQNELVFIELRKKPYIVENELDRVITSREFIQIRKNDGSYEPWIPSHSDMLSNDWKIIELKAELH